jgi:hypothetical protein
MPPSPSRRASTKGGCLSHNLPASHVRGIARRSDTDENGLHILHYRNRSRDHTDASGSILNHVPDARLDSDSNIYIVPRDWAANAIRAAMNLQVSPDTSPLNADRDRPTYHALIASDASRECSPTHIGM